MKVCIAGQGAFGIKHIEAIQKIPGIEIVTLAGGSPDSTARSGAEVQHSALVRRISRSASQQPGVEAGNPGHADADARRRRASSACAPASTCRSKSRWPTPWPTPRRSARVQKETGLICMGGHTRRFNPSHQWVHKKIVAGELKIQQMDVQTYFFRRTNMNALGKPRSWTDHLLWHHACHTVDLFQYQTGETASVARARAGSAASRARRSPWT